MRTQLDWRRIYELPADGVVRTVAGMEAVHHPATKILREVVMLHDGDDALIRAKRADGRWTNADRVNWNGGRR